MVQDFFHPQYVYTLSEEILHQLATLGKTMKHNEEWNYNGINHLYIYQLVQDVFHPQYIYIYIYVWVFVYIYIYIYINTRLLYIYIHTYIFPYTGICILYTLQESKVTIDNPPFVHLPSYKPPVTEAFPAGHV